MKKRYNKPIPFGWFALEYSANLAPGEVQPLYYFGRELVLFRTESGEAKLLDAYCPHLGAHLGHGGHVAGENIACPFHGWQFNGEGECREVPYAKRIPPKVENNQSVGAYPVLERNKMIWAWYHPGNAAPSFDVEIVPEFDSPDWTELDVFEWTINTIPQETGENAADVAHFMYVHSSPEMPQGEVTMDGIHRTTLLHNKVPKVNEQGEIDMTGTEWETLRVESISIGPGQTFQRLTRAFDLIMMGTVTPIDDQSLQLRFSFTMPKSQVDMNKLFAEGTRDNIVTGVEQDIPIWEHKRYVEAPILCDGDGPIAKYRKWFNQFYIRT
jgi:phenylpropionate dioxygenase-like ring-hydroxylating dioxygenase large terminal subunit